MKLTAFALALFLLFFVSCKEKVTEVQPGIQVGHNMKIFPETPGSKDVIKLVIYDDCMYNALSSDKRSGKTIEIEKQFNSMMKMPCMIRNDTISIGKLPQGSYTVNYKLLDTSTLVTQTIAFSTTLELVVSK